MAEELESPVSLAVRMLSLAVTNDIMASLDTKLPLACNGDAAQSTIAAQTFLHAIAAMIAARSVTNHPGDPFGEIKRSVAKAAEDLERIAMQHATERLAGISQGRAQ